MFLFLKSYIFAQKSNMITSIIQTSLQKAYSYAEYMAMMDNLVAEKRSTGEDQSPIMIQFTQLNYQRMKRLDKTIKIPENTANQIKTFSKKQTWIVITESWCGDASQSVPVLNKIAETNPNIELKLVLRDENQALIDAFLTNGTRSIPKLIIADTQTLDVLDVWGPRPAIATQMVQDFKTKHGKLTSEFKEELQKWYNKDKGQSVIQEIINIQNNLK